jgi:uncharacterized protein involved in exopolysaccharide biosynthesis
MTTRDTDPSDQDADLFDHQRARDYLAFLAGSVRRRRGLMVAVVVCFMALAFSALAALPRTYHVEAKLLAQRSPALAVRGDGQDSNMPMKAAVEMVHQRDNLVSIIQATSLLDHWAQHRAPAVRAVDAVRAMFHHDDDGEKLDAMVERLEKELNVWSTDGTVTISLNWPDAEMAALLVEIAQQNFLEARHAQEITALAESIGIYKEHATTLRASVDDAVAALERARAQEAPVRGDRDVTPAHATPSPHPAAKRAADRPELEQARTSLAAKTRALEDLEESRRRRLAEAQAKLAEERSTYTDNHPAVLDMKQTISALQAPSPQVRTLREEVSALHAELAKSSGGDPAPGFAMATAAPAPIPSDVLRLEQDLREEKDPAILYARGQLRDAMERYAALTEKLQAAQIDLDTTQAAFKYRYNVLTPAKVPRHPSKPNVPLILIVAFLASLVSALVIAVIADVASGRLVERWQVERMLDRPILGDVELARLPPYTRPAR